MHDCQNRIDQSESQIVFLKGRLEHPFDIEDICRQINGNTRTEYSEFFNAWQDGARDRSVILPSKEVVLEFSVFIGRANQASRHEINISKISQILWPFNNSPFDLIST